MQKQIDSFNRRHNVLPQSSNEVILANTIQPLQNRKLKIPFRYLRTWIFSLLALIALPLGIGFIMIGAEMLETLTQDWREVTATVVRNDETGVTYRVDSEGLNNQGAFGYTLDYFVDADIAGQLVWTVSACDALSWLIIPKDSGAEFSLWINDDKPSRQSCVPITQDFAALYLLVGFVLAGLSIIRLIRTFHAAAIQPK